MVDRRSIELVVSAIGEGYSAACGDGPGPPPGDDYVSACARVRAIVCALWAPWHRSIG